MRFKDIPQIARSYYNIHTSWKYLEDTLDCYFKNFKLEIEPDFQRAHVWTEDQQIKYVEWILRGGESGRIILFNSPGWMGNNHGGKGNMVLVDGLQRITAARKFMSNNLPIFNGNYLKDFTDKFPWLDKNFVFYINNLKTREEDFQWYIDINSGGTIYTIDEIKKVKELLNEEQK